MAHYWLLCIDFKLALMTHRLFCANVLLHMMFFYNLSGQHSCATSFIFPRNCVAGVSAWFWSAYAHRGNTSLCFKVKNSKEKQRNLNGSNSSSAGLDGGTTASWWVFVSLSDFGGKTLIPRAPQQDSPLIPSRPGQTGEVFMAVGALSSSHQLPASSFSLQHFLSPPHAAPSWTSHA